MFTGFTGLQGPPGTQGIAGEKGASIVVRKRLTILTRKKQEKKN